MAEKKLVAGKQTVSFSGIFNMKELYNFVDSWFAQHGFDKNENKNVMQVTEQGKYLLLEILPQKTISDYAKAIIKVVVLSEGYKDITVQRNGINVDMHQGKVDVSVQGFLIGDAEGRWQEKPLYFVMRMLFERFIFPTYESKQTGVVKEFFNEFIRDLKVFFNMYRL
ncbi:hypothetical protein JXM83_03385 [Candidatus Woesearchaeota archaeon]|nr:hypothetical protein [Candidatus Woesearchaeota archaeon]